MTLSIICGPMNMEAVASRVRRVRHEVKRRRVDVVRVEALGPGFVRIVFGGDSLADFVSASFDDHVKFILGADGDSPVARDYTPRRFDAAGRELTIEFALHGDGPVAGWAAEARPGQQVTIGGPKGSLVIPTDYAWHLFCGDETALPAISRRLEELPARSRALVVAQVDDPADRRAFAGAADLEVRWVGRDGSLVDAVRALDLPAGDGYAWCAGEAAAMAALRRVLVDEKGHDRHAIRAAAYWKRGAVAHHENLEG